VHVMTRTNTVFGLIVFRLVSGLVGTHFARFSSFRYGPSEAVTYLKEIVTGGPSLHRPQPAGSWAVSCTARGRARRPGVSGYLNFNEVGGDAMEEMHEVLAKHCGYWSCAARGRCRREQHRASREPGEGDGDGLQDRRRAPSRRRTGGQPRRSRNGCRVCSGSGPGPRWAGQGRSAPHRPRRRTRANS